MTLQELMTRWNGYQIEMRRWFHQHPEESTKEVRTAERIRAELDRAGYPAASLRPRHGHARPHRGR